MSKNVLGKYLFITSDLSWPKDGIYRVLRRISRETKSQFISDVQRVPYYFNKNGRRVFDWEKFVWFQIIARRFRKNKLFNEDGSFTDYYGKTTLIDGDFSSMLSDTPFDEMFNVVKGNSRDDLFNYELKRMKSVLSNLFSKNRKAVSHNVCLDTEGYVGKSLKEVFGVDVYIVDRMWDEKRFKDGHYRHNYNRSCDFERNAVFHQVTSSGGDKDIISKEDNNHNVPILLWFFKDRIVYKEESGKSEF